MATMAQAVTQLSKDLGDFFGSTTTGAGSSTTVEDSLFGDQDSDNFLTQNQQMTLHFTATGDERRIDISTGFTGGPPVDLLTITRSAAGNGNGKAYTIHRLFTFLEKEEAINQAVNLVWPRMFERIQATVTTVVNQMDYDVSAAGIFRDTVRDARRVSSGDTEAERRIFNWNMRIDDTSGAKKFHLKQQPLDVHTINIYGHKKMALADYTDGEDLLVVAARAGRYLLEQLLANSIVTDRSHAGTLLQLQQNNFVERLAQYKREEIPFALTNGVYSRKNRTNQFDVA